MRKIISNKRYDTDTAQCIGVWDNGRFGGDIFRCEETLYRKRNGEFFLYGCGGPGSKYAVSCGDNNWRGGHEIIPLTYETARQWAEEHLPADDYKEFFGTIDESDTKVSATFRLSASVLQNVRRRASEAGIGISEYIESRLK